MKTPSLGHFGHRHPQEVPRERAGPEFILLAGKIDRNGEA